MSKPVVLVTGADGQLGRALREALSPRALVVSTSRKELDLRDADAIRRTVRSLAPRAIVNAAAWTAVDAAEGRRDDAFAINAAAPGVLAEEAARIDAILVHYSTDYVFDGESRTPYTETHPTHALGVYGASKLAGEGAVLAAGGRPLILRTSWLYSPHGRSFFDTMVRLAESSALRDTPVRVVNDRHGTPTSCRFVAEATSAVLGHPRVREAPSGDAVWGIYHLTGSGETTWHGFAEAIFAGVAARGGRVPHLEAIPSSAYPTPAVRPAYSVLDTRKLAWTFGVMPTPWQDQLEQVLDDRLGRSRASAAPPSAAGARSA
jgi:dTDP-4-dehydrorhamnose reductase